MTRTTTYRVTIAIASHGGGDIPALLDMLRYEGSRVLTWDHGRDARDRETYTVTIASERFTPDRWQSFGIYPEVI